MKEIDVVNILETVQKTKLLYASGLQEHQKVLSNFQNRNLIQSEDMTVSTDDYTEICSGKH